MIEKSQDKGHVEHQGAQRQYVDYGGKLFTSDFIIVTAATFPFSQS